MINFLKLKDPKTNKPLNIKPEYYYRYAQTLKSKGDYDASDKVMDQFVALTGKKRCAWLYYFSKTRLSG